MRSISAAMALYALCLSTLFVPDTLGQTRPGNSRSPIAETLSQQPQDADASPDGSDGGSSVIQSPSSSQIDIVGPAGSGQFGSQVYVLPNGNIVITDPLYDITTPTVVADVGAVYLYDGETLEMISQLTGSSANDQVGNGGITILANGNFVVRSLAWANGVAQGAGGATWGHEETGVSGTVSAENSLVGTTVLDQVGSAITTLSNGNYVVTMVGWDNGAVANAGAATWGNGSTGTAGTVSPSNSLVGSSANDNVGGVITLANGNYVAVTTGWDNGSAVNAGAVTLGNKDTGVSGTVSSSNSLVGSTSGDSVGVITVLSNGNYIVRTSNWDHGATQNVGAVTWGDGDAGVVGAISSSNSLVGSTANDLVGNGQITELVGGNYIVQSFGWDNGGAADAGAVTFGKGDEPITGVVSPANSLVGSTLNDQIGAFSALALSNGNYVISSRTWNNGAITDAGAVTWGNGVTGTTGPVSASNSLVGSAANDQIGIGGVAAVGNGNYVVTSYAWDNAAAVNAGAVTWCNGLTGRIGPVTTANSLVGGATQNEVGLGGVIRLTNGNYVIRSIAWDNASAPAAGAVTWALGNAGISGVVSPSNSLVGTRTSHSVGAPGVTALRNGNYVVSSGNWGTDTATQLGAVTWGNGLAGTSGAVSEANSLVGSAAGDNIGNSVVPLTNGNYAIVSFLWNNGSATAAGAVTLGNGLGGTFGPISPTNSLVGSSVSDNIGFGGVTALPNGNFVVMSQSWDGPGAVDAGAVTFGNGSNGVVGQVSAVNSLVGSVFQDRVGNASLIVTPDGNYLVRSSSWDSPMAVNGGAVTYGAGNGGTVGTVESNPSVVGTVANDVGFPAERLSNESVVVPRRFSNTVIILNPTYRAVADGNWSSASTWNYGAFEKAHDVVIPEYMEVVLDTDIPGPDGSLRIEAMGELAVNENRASGSPIRNEGVFNLYSGKLDMGSNVFTSACFNNDFIATPSSYIIGALSKEICVGTMYQFPIGTADGYTPVQAHVTSVGASPSSLTVSSTANVHPTLYAPNSLKRFWSITEVGDLTADLTFNYLDSDVEGSEAGYKLFRIEGAGLPETMSTAVLNADANSMSINGVSQFSDWAIGSLAPSAAAVKVTGRVTAGGRPVSRAYVTFSGMDGSVRYAVTNTFGYYRIEGLAAGSAYTATVESRRYTFDARVVNLGDDLTGFDFEGR